SIPTAKRRYYKRVTEDVKLFVQMGQEVKRDNLSGASSAEFWSAGLDDLTSAGYLLAVAFKIDSRIPPDKIPNKRDHDALMAAIGKLRKAVNGENEAAAKEQYADTLEKMEKYLKGVELPPSSDAMYQ
ncbi:hypothetical protein T492DRAFT_850578, partial [Pavlovales sp. CCMP2436]